MISITKIFRFETAHAIHRYKGDCKNIHGHSYELHVTVRGRHADDGYVEGLGIIIDFKDLKSIVQSEVVKVLDHKLLLSHSYLTEINPPVKPEEVVVFDAEPTAENILIYTRDKIRNALPESIELHSLKLWETRDSYAEWSH